MRRWRLRLHYRIVVPFALVAFVAIGATAYVALAVTSRALESDVEEHIASAAMLVSQSDFALNPVILHSVKAIAGAEVLTFTDSGATLASTIDPGRQALATVMHAASPDPDRRMKRLDCGYPCYVVYRRLSSRPDAMVAVVADVSDVMTVTRTVTRTILVAALLSLLVMVWVSQLVARRVTAPLNDLVLFTRHVAAGDPTLRANAGDDEIGRLGGAFNDMLERLEHSREALVRSEKLGLAGLFAARVAHDIRNPLSAIKMQAQLLRARIGTADAASQDMLAAVLRDVTQVESVISDLLELSRPGELRRQPTRLNDVVRQALEQLMAQLTHRKITVHTQLGDPLPAVLMDVDRFKLALLNVLNNAADAMPTGGALMVATSADSASTIRLDVCDDGTGVEPGILDRVFDPFVSTKQDGVGLGLVNTKAVVESHGGRIELAPLSTGGTRVTIWLPVDAPTQATHG